jgi:hypothetical protein
MRAARCAAGSQKRAKWIPEARGSAVVGIGGLVIFALTLWWTLRRFQEDYEQEIKVYGRHP